MKKMALFDGLQIALDLSYSLSFKKKSELRKQIVENGGTISHIVTRKCQFVLTSDPEKCDVSSKCRIALKYRLPVLKLDYIWDCLVACKLLPKESYIVGGKSKFLDFKSGKISAAEETEKPKKFCTRTVFSPRSVKIWLAEDKNQPYFNEMTFEVAKYAIFGGQNKVTKLQTAYILELHTPPGVRENQNLDDVMDDNRNAEQTWYRITLQTGNQKDLEEGKPGHIEHRYVSSADQALSVYAMLYEDLEKKPEVVKYVSHLRGLGSQKLQKLLAELINVNEQCSEEVKKLVEHIWQEAMAEVTTTLGDISTIRLEQVEKAEAILIKIREAIKNVNSNVKFEDLVREFYSTLPHTNEKPSVSELERKRWLVQKQDMCQLIKDMISVSELTDYQTRAYVEAKYAALRCRITHLDGDKRQELEELVKSSVDNLSILNVYEVWRQVEDLDFHHDIEPKSLLFHSSKVENFVGILSRGLLLPKVVVDDFGGKRSDVGMLGSGIYFASAASTSVKYSSPSKSKGTRLLLINEVALGQSKEYLDYALDLVAPPEGYQSTHGVSKKFNKLSKFENDEYVVYAANQQRLRYLVEFTLADDKIKTIVEEEVIDSNIVCETIENITINDVTDIVDPLTKVKPGLIGHGNVNVELRGVHIRAKLVDLAAQVVVLQEYYNNTPLPIEAKYVFPLDDTAAVCGFEAFINGKHIIGEVKEKEVAHREYKKAISEGHGAYLMDQDEETPDVFTVSVGNLPSGACVLIKVTYVAELQVEDEKISFRLPATVAPWKEDSALKNSTQEELKSFKMSAAKTTVQVALEMPFEIRSLHCPTHKIRVKQTASKAFVEMARLQNFGSVFQLLIGLAEIHVPRMWVERLPDNSQHQACMLTFFPEFESAEMTEGEIVLALDVSNSMKGDPLVQAKKVALLVLKSMPAGWHFNVVRFGSDFDELFPAPKLNTEENLKAASLFIQKSTANKGNTEVLRPLRSLFLLPTSGQRNIFLISDGHINNDEVVMRCARLNSSHNRVFSFGVSSTCNIYSLKALSRVSGGSFEFFNTKTKSKWEPKVKAQINKASQPGLTAVTVEWRQYDDNLPPPVQAPRQITAMFSGSRQVIYGYVPNCTMATLTANVGGQQASTVVSTSELSITEGHLVHRLTAKAVIRDWEDGVLSADRTGHEIAKMDMKNYIIDLSKEYSIVTQFTSFIAVEKREENEKETLPSGPQISELVDQENVDILQYMGWTKSLEGDEIPLDSLIQDLRADIEQNNLSNRMLSRLPAIEEKNLLLREKFGPCNKEMLLTSKFLMEAYMLQSDQTKAANLAVETFKECLKSISQVLNDSENYTEVAEILSDIRTRAATLPQLKEKLQDKIPLSAVGQGRILVKTLTGKEISITSRSNMSVLDLKHLVEEADGSPVQQQRLIFNGRNLEDRCLLEHYNIGYGDTLHLVHRLRGGGDSYLEIVDFQELKMDGSDEGVDYLGYEDNFNLVDLDFPCKKKKEGRLKLEKYAYSGLRVTPLMGVTRRGPPPRHPPSDATDMVPSDEAVDNLEYRDDLLSVKRRVSRRSSNLLSFKRRGGEVEDIYEEVIHRAPINVTHSETKLSNERKSSAKMLVTDETKGYPQSLGPQSDNQKASTSTIPAAVNEPVAELLKKNISFSHKRLNWKTSIRSPDRTETSSKGMLPSSPTSLTNPPDGNPNLSSMSVTDATPHLKAPDPQYSVMRFGSSASSSLSGPVSRGAPKSPNYSSAPPLLQSCPFSELQPLPPPPPPPRPSLQRRPPPSLAQPPPFGSCLSSEQPPPIPPQKMNNYLKGACFGAGSSATATKSSVFGFGSPVAASAVTFGAGSFATATKPSVFGFGSPVAASAVTFGAGSSATITQPSTFSFGHPGAIDRILASVPDSAPAAFASAGLPPAATFEKAQAVCDGSEGTAFFHQDLLKPSMLHTSSGGLLKASTLLPKTPPQDSNSYSRRISRGAQVSVDGFDERSLYYKPTSKLQTDSDMLCVYLDVNSPPPECLPETGFDFLCADEDDMVYESIGLSPEPICDEKAPEQCLSTSNEHLCNFGIGAHLTSIRRRAELLNIKDVFTLLELQLQDGSWTLNSELDQLIGIDSAALEAILYSSGLSSLGATAEENIKKYLAMLLVLFCFLNLIDLYVDVEKFISKVFFRDEDGAIKFQSAINAKAWQGGRDQSDAMGRAVEKMFQFHEKFTSRHPLVYSTLELGRSWGDVVNKLMTPLPWH